MKQIVFSLLFIISLIIQAHASRFDHVSIVVRDLESAISVFSNAGFKIKRGQPHSNGLLNAFIKIEDRSYIELISVNNPTDDLAIYYAKVLKDNGEGPVFIAFEKDRVGLEKSYPLVLEKWKDFATLSYAFSHPLHAYFLIEYYKTPDDREYVNHDNGIFKINELHLGAFPNNQKLDPQFYPLPAYLNFKEGWPLVHRIVFQRRCNSTKSVNDFKKFGIEFHVNPGCTK